jgi:hypothetical protein
MIPNVELSNSFLSEQPNSSAGWVPTISGQLSYSVIGQTSTNGACSYFNDVFPSSEASPLQNPVRFIAMHQQRVAPDFPIPDRILRWIVPSTVQDYFLIAETRLADVPLIFTDATTQKTGVTLIGNAQGVLIGSVAVLLHDNDKSTKKIHRAFSDKFVEIMKTSQQSDADKVKIELLELIRKARIDGIPLFTVQFALFRTGEFRLWFPEGMESGVESSDVLKVAQDAIPSQAYYFVKDMVHRHYHHHRAADQILTLTETGIQVDQLKENEIAWRRKTLWGLVRVVMQYRRRGRRPDLNKAVGILAYASAFQQNFGRCIRSISPGKTFEPTDQLHLYDFSHMKDSIDVTVDDRQIDRTAFWQFLTLAIAIMFSVFAIWGTSGATMQALCDPAKTNVFSERLAQLVHCPISIPSYMMSTQQFISRRPLEIVILAVFIAYIVYDTVLRDLPITRGRIGTFWGKIRESLLLLVRATYCSLYRLKWNPLRFQHVLASLVIYVILVSMVLVSTYAFLRAIGVDTFN